MFDKAFPAVLNHLLDGANWARTRLKPFAGRRARIEMPPFVIGFAVNDAGRVRQDSDTTAPDVVIRLPADTPFLLPQGLDKVMAGANVMGNAEFATELSFVLRQLRWDAEEDLAKLVGDIVAHRLVQSAGRLFAWQKQFAKHCAENLSEYLTQENPLLVATADEYADLQDGIADLNAELTRVERHLASTYPN